MKAITVHQPWAWAIIHAGKDIENRSWNWGGTGELAIHAGKTWDPYGEVFMLRLGIHVPSDDLVSGAIIGVVNVTGVHHANRCTEQFGLPSPKRCSQWATPMSYHWKLDRPRPIEPISCRGKQQLWNVPEDAEALIRKQLEVTR